VRETGAPDLDSLNLSLSGETDFIYMTYRTGHIDDFFACYLEPVSSSTPVTITFGTISNGSFVPNENESYTFSSNGSHYYYFNEKSVGYIVIRITGQIKIMKLIGAASTNGTPGGVTFTNY